MICEYCGDDDKDFIRNVVHQCNVCEKWICEFCIYHNGTHPH